ncbi:PREDICTED: pheromone-binding protein Gp-9-like [Acromyrmex echinatior]|uniref:pheromone-binding protein Gp-9-like n=1 Tax=Acromyrmex echinatior TaxID=103372 RepID=UPI000580DE8C|nr:PREDICTED: pheromone-binding protein Gp-9-like [Acromyrmex echinatior]
MKKILLYICTFVFISFTVESKKIGSINTNYNICLTEINVSEDDMLSVQDIIHDRYKSENQEKLNKNGCVLQCIFQKCGLVEGAEYKVENMRIEFIKRIHIQPGDKRLEKLENCINETKDLPEKCQKVFLLTVCLLKSVPEYLHQYTDSAK